MIGSARPSGRLLLACAVLFTALPRPIAGAQSLFDVEARLAPQYLQY